jgi:hypothetical protein
MRKEHLFDACLSPPRSVIPRMEVQYEADSPMALQSVGAASTMARHLRQMRVREDIQVAHPVQLFFYTPASLLLMVSGASSRVPIHYSSRSDLKVRYETD